MTIDDSETVERRVLVLTPTARDAALARSVLDQAGVACACCSDMDQVCHELDAGAGTVLLPEEAVDSDLDECLAKWVASQPPWSDLPVLVLSRPGADSAAVAQAMDLLGNVTVLERPTRVAAFVSAVRSALRARQRQYQVRDHLVERERSIEAQARLAAIVASSDDAIISKSLDGIIRSWNGGAERIFGYSANEAIGQSITFLIPPERLEEEASILARLRAGERIEQFETVRIARDGRHIDVSLTVSPIRDAAGRISGASKVARDVTGLKRAQQSLEASEQRFRNIFQNAGVSLWEEDFSGVKAAVDTLRDQGITDFERYFEEHPEFVRQAMDAIRVLDVNDATVTLFEARDKRELLGSLPKIFVPESMRALLGELLAVAEGRTYFEAEARLNTVRGNPLHVFFTMVLPDPGEPYDRVLFSVFDISRRKDAEDALRMKEERFRSLVSVITDVPWVTDAAGAFVVPQPEWEAYTGQTWLEHRGFGWAEAFHPDDRQLVKQLWERACETRTLYESHGRLWHAPSRQYRFFVARATPILNADQTVREWIGTCTDVHEQRLGEEALRDADRRKDEFLAVLAHELRNPLAPIRNSLPIFRMTGQNDPAAQRVGEMMERQVNHMVRLVDDLLEVSRITRGNIELRKERVELGAIVRSATETSRPLIEASGHQLDVTIPAEPVILNGDPVRLTQIVANLLNNAAKYTDAGGHIWLTTRREGDEVAISVRDTGIGIAPSMLPRVFDLFTQIDRSADRAQGGLGIGLTLVKRLVEMHGGSVTAHSEGKGRGSEFVVRLPIPLAGIPIDTPGKETGPRAFLVPLRVLVVDDHRDSADSLGMVLKMLGADTHVVYDGPDALKALATFEPSVVFLDIGMPGMDGHEVARRIRHQPQSQNLTLIALTGWGQEEDYHRSKTAGFNHHVVKPASVGALRALLASLQDGPRSGREMMRPTVH